MRRAEQPEDIDYLRKLGYESRDVAFKPLVKAGVWFTIFCILSAVVTAVIYIALVPDHVAKPSLKLPPNQPLLQDNITRKKDMRDLLAAEEKVLHNYGWVDQSKGIAHIPIERAIELTAERGLPVRPGATRPEGAALPEVPTDRPGEITTQQDAGHAPGNNHE